jgi:acyl carrier protein
MPQGDDLITSQAAAAAGEGAGLSTEPSKADTLAAMRRALAKRFGIENPDLSEDRELATLGLDSLAFIEYTFDLEGELHIVLPDLPRDLVTIGDFVQYVHGEVLRQAAGRDPK